MSKIHSGQPSGWFKKKPVKKFHEQTFEEFCKAKGIDKENKIARQAWNAAIESCASIVEDRYDPCEPWLDVEDITNLKA